MDGWLVRPFTHGGYDFEGVHGGIPPILPLPTVCAHTAINYCKKTYKVQIVSGLPKDKLFVLFSMSLLLAVCWCCKGWFIFHIPERLRNNAKAPNRPCARLEAYVRSTVYM